MPTIIQRTIGTGGDLATIGDWLVATNGKHLVNLDIIEEGRLLNQEHIITAQQSIGGCTTDSTRYRRLTCHTVPYDRRTDTGPKIKYEGSAGVTGLFISEHNFQLVGVGVHNKYTVSTAQGITVYMSANSNFLVDKCWIAYELHPDRSTGAFNGAFYTGNPGVAGIIRNSIVECIGSVPAAGSAALRLDTNVSAINVTCIKAYGPGFEGTGKAYNCVALRSNLNRDFGTSITGDYNLSEDNTAVGTTKFVNQAVSSVIEDIDNRDYRPKKTGNAYGTGFNYSSIFTDDYNGATRTIWSLGALEYELFLLSVPLLLSATPETKTSINIEFSGAADGYSNWLIYSSLDNNSYSLVTSSIASSIDTYSISGFNESQAAWFKVKTSDTSNISEFSNALSSVTKPGEVSSINLVKTKNGVTLNWEDSSNNELGYNVYRNGILIAVLPPNTTSYTNTIIPTEDLENV